MAENGECKNDDFKIFKIMEVEIKLQTLDESVPSAGKRKVTPQFRDRVYSEIKSQREGKTLIPFLTRSYYN